MKKKESKPVILKKRVYRNNQGQRHATIKNLTFDEKVAQPMYVKTLHTRPSKITKLWDVQVDQYGRNVVEDLQPTAKRILTPTHQHSFPKTNYPQSNDLENQNDEIIPEEIHEECIEEELQTKSAPQTPSPKFEKNTKKGQLVRRHSVTLPTNLNANIVHGNKLKEKITMSPELTKFRSSLESLESVKQDLESGKYVTLGEMFPNAVDRNDNEITFNQLNDVNLSFVQIEREIKEISETLNELNQSIISRNGHFPSVNRDKKVQSLKERKKVLLYYKSILSEGLDNWSEYKKARDEFLKHRAIFSFQEMGDRLEPVEMQRFDEEYRRWKTRQKALAKHKSSTSLQRIIDQVDAMTTASRIVDSIIKKLKMEGSKKKIDKTLIKRKLTEEIIRWKERWGSQNKSSTNKNENTQESSKSMNEDDVEIVIINDTEVIDTTTPSKGTFLTSDFDGEEEDEEYKPTNKRNAIPMIDKMIKERRNILRQAQKNHNLEKKKLEKQVDVLQSVNLNTNTPTKSVRYQNTRDVEEVQFMDSSDDDLESRIVNVAKKLFEKNPNKDLSLRKSILEKNAIENVFVKSDKTKEIQIDWEKEVSKHNIMEDSEEDSVVLEEDEPISDKDKVKQNLNLVQLLSQLKTQLEFSDSSNHINQSNDFVFDNHSQSSLSDMVLQESNDMETIESMDNIAKPIQDRTVSPSPRIDNESSSEKLADLNIDFDMNDPKKNNKLLVELDVLLGTGGYSKVYKGKIMETGEIVAIKKIPVSQGRFSKKFFKLEVDMWRQLSNEHVVKYLGCTYSSRLKEFSIVLEYIDGGSLEQQIKENGPMTEERVACITKQVLIGLNYLHSKMIIHRDLKPANILITKNGIVKISDFGVSTQLVNIESMRTSCVGTPHYSAPEVIQVQPYSFKCDIWSLGCSVYEMLTGNRPYHNLNHVTAMQRMVNDDHPPLPNMVSETCKDFLLSCWVKDPEKRPNASELLKHPFVH